MRRVSRKILINSNHIEMRFIKVVLFFWLTVFYYSSGWSQSISKSAFSESVKKILNHPQLSNASVSIHVIKTENNEEVFSYEENKTLCPASTMKLFTTSSALLLLGENFTFSTQLKYSGTWRDGVLNGDLYLIGSGDPSLTTDDFSKIKLEKPLNRITGNVIGVDAAFDSQLIPRGWIWEDIGNYYAAPISSLNINQNKYELYFQSFEEGKETKFLGSSPDLSSLVNFNNEVVSGAKGSGDQAYIFGSPRSNQRFIRGSIPPHRNRFKIKGALPFPSLQTTHSMVDYMKGLGVEIQGETLVSNLEEKNLNLISVIQSETLSNLITEVNHKSNNLYAECLAKAISHQKLGVKGSTEKGIERIRNEWENRGLPMSGFNMEDGSGLSRFNSVTSRQMTLMLSKMTRTNVFNSFKKSIPIVGKSGTVKYMCRSSIANGKIHAKSGSMKRVLAYSGYAENMDSEEFAFAIIINNYDDSKTIRPLIEKFFDQLVQVSLVD
ncbi:D-alanyl-D-alanine carboxypeptidase/D-alanyl-D-alanine endopeptidase [Sediminitomix flava]|uniref:D-alanyl-D-alanine carboxypeptidase/D-alanyl-D-alanine-endopeptidase (Penicillin-binding protein 4) n=1 Tax=Sediminitomix flava TaxID=379075 RepID=A0A315ZB47_SEDFL|nr:D-alanyl-D-alanine carboxypeptidase/D-alanyl-D-alanine-endopeptidase [Sediminitomix flava]PWJ42512.1 D-alanyl-D-alanine carboxypeptidase/D-alanyl-D-alanine-endopeptidase (penicillin-binding protein 4) [Sediminitomix flava]